MFSRKSHVGDGKKSALKIIDLKKDHVTRLKHLRIVLDTYDENHIRTFFNQYYSHIYHLFYDGFINVEANLSLRVNKAHREELDYILYILEKILILLPDMIHKRWQIYSIGRIMKKLLHIDNSNKVRKEGIRLFIIWYQILMNNATNDCHNIFKSIVPNIYSSDGLHKSTSFLELFTAKNFAQNRISIAELTPILPAQSTEKALENPTKYFLEVLLHYMVSEVNKIIWSNSDIKFLALNFLFERLKQFYFYEIFKDCSTSDTLYSPKFDLIEVRQKYNASIEMSSIQICQDVTIQWLAVYTHAGLKIPLDSNTIEEEKVERSTPDPLDSKTHTLTNPGTTLGSNISTLSADDNSNGDLAENCEENLGPNLTDQHVGGLMALGMEGDLLRRVLYSNRDNIILLHHVFALAFTKPNLSNNGVLIIKQVVNVYKSWLQANPLPVFLIDPKVKNCVSRPSSLIENNCELQIKLPQSDSQMSQTTVDLKSSKSDSSLKSSQNTLLSIAEPKSQDIYSSNSVATCDLAKEVISETCFSEHKCNFESNNLIAEKNMDEHINRGLLEISPFDSKEIEADIGLSESFSPNAQKNADLFKDIKSIGYNLFDVNKEEYKSKDCSKHDVITLLALAHGPHNKDKLLNVEESVRCIEAVPPSSDELRSGLQNFLVYVFTNSMKIFTFFNEPSTKTNTKEFLEAIERHSDICKRVLNLYRFIIINCNMNQATWDQLLMVLLRTCTLVLSTTELNRNEEKNKIVQDTGSLSNILAEPIFKALIMTWIRASLNSTISPELWKMLLNCLSSLTHSIHLIKEWTRTMDILTKLLSKYVYNINLMDLPLDRLTEQKVKRLRGVNRGGIYASNKDKEKTNSTINRMKQNNPTSSNTTVEDGNKSNATRQRSRSGDISPLHQPMLDANSSNPQTNCGACNNLPRCNSDSSLLIISNERNEDGLEVSPSTQRTDQSYSDSEISFPRKYEGIPIDDYWNFLNEYSVSNFEYKQLGEGLSTSPLILESDCQSDNSREIDNFFQWPYDIKFSIGNNNMETCSNSVVQPEDSAYALVSSTDGDKPSSDEEEITSNVDDFISYDANNFQIALDSQSLISDKICDNFNENQIDKKDIQNNNIDYEWNLNDVQNVVSENKILLCTTSLTNASHINDEHLFIKDISNKEKTNKTTNDQKMIDCTKMTEDDLTDDVTSNFDRNSIGDKFIEGYLKNENSLQNQNIDLTDDAMSNFDRNSIGDKFIEDYLKNENSMQNQNIDLNKCNNENDIELFLSENKDNDNQSMMQMCELGNRDSLKMVEDLDVILEHSEPLKVATKIGWNADNVILIWKRMLGSLGDVNKIQSSIMHEKIFEYFCDQYDAFIKIRLNQGVTKDNLLTPEMPKFTPPFLYMVPWFYQALELDNKFKSGQLLALRLICTSLFRRPDLYIPNNHLVRLYLTIHLGLKQWNSDGRNMLMLHTSPHLFTHNIPSLSLLILDYVHACDNILSSNDKLARRFESIQMLGTLYSYSQLFGNSNLPQIDPELNHISNLLTSDIQDKIVNILMKIGKFETSGISRCLILSNLTLFVHIELFKDHVNPQFSVAITLILSMLKVNDLWVNITACQMISSFSDLIPLLIIKYDNVIVNIIEELMTIIMQQIVTMNNLPLEGAKKSLAKLIINLLFVLSDWLMKLPLEFLKKKLYSHSHENILMTYFEILELLMESNSNHSINTKTLNFTTSMPSTLSSNYEPDQIVDSVTSSISQKSFLSSSLNMNPDETKSKITKKLNDNENTVNFNQVNGLNNLSTLFDDPYGLKLASIMTHRHITNFLGHFPISDSCMLSSAISEEDDLINSCHDEDPLAALSMVFASPLTQFFVLNNSSIVSMIHLQNNNAIYGSNCRIIIRDISGKFAWHVAHLPNYNKNPIKGNNFNKDLLVIEEENEIFEDDVDVFKTKLNRPIKCQSTSQLPHPEELPSVFNILDKSDGLDLILRYIGTVSPECQLIPDQPLNAPSNRPPQISASDEQHMLDIIQLQCQSEKEYLQKKHSRRSMESVNSLKSMKEVSQPFDVCRSFLHQLGWLQWDKRNQLDLLMKNDKLLKELKHLDTQRCRETHKIAVIYVAFGQEDKTSILTNASGSKNYSVFLSAIGWEVDLGTHTGFMGGLQRNGTNGVNSIYYATSSMEIMYHVATFMPSNNEEDIMRKLRHLGNDEVQIIWCEHERDYRRGIIPTEFADIIIVIYPLHNTLYRIQILRKPEVHYFGPLHDGCIVSLKNLPTLVRWTVINGSRTLRALRSFYLPFYEDRMKSIMNVIKKFKIKSTYETFASQIYRPTSSDDGPHDFVLPTIVDGAQPTIGHKAEKVSRLKWRRASTDVISHRAHDDITNAALFNRKQSLGKPKKPSNKKHSLLSNSPLLHLQNK